MKQIQGQRKSLRANPEVSRNVFNFSRRQMVIKHRRATLLRWLKKFFATRPCFPPEIQRARKIIAAIDAGGMPLNPQ
ncbi:MAG: hypothetical protein ABTS22_00850 [Accumulibacter sp.]|uniref:hypothetical protein n=1 Tax=Accumulibacter sp. TaxID=2053492 RepID=UPI00331633A3